MKKDIVNENDKGQLHGEQIGYYDNGHIMYKHNYNNGNKHGELIGYWGNGKIFYKEYYIKGKLVSTEEWIAYNRKLKMKMITNL
jgi:antitoxin component YwqK of YwqJK toxin-antitoxin module